ncbi:sodium-dependent neutral amino acid transporter SLC6A17-like protein [Cricetulus griseus]|nr:sodium-dependent neutral amino acid transporter SLC6A17-like protein [Cricetulus griseus]
MHMLGALSPASRVLERTITNLVKLITKGVLSQAVWPPQDLIHKPPLEYLLWINQLPRNLQEEVVHFSLPCSILVQTEKFMQGPGLAYVAFSQAVSLFPGSSFWAIIFFMALVITVFICLGGLLGSLVFTSRPGSYVVFLFDDHVVPMVLIIIVVFQNLSLAWVYGIKRFRAEMFGQLGRLVWAPFTFLWSYVTLPTLLALLTIYFLNFYHSESLYYISWNDSMSQEVKQPYQKVALGWVTFLSVLALLPIPMYPLQHWWHLDNQIICEIVQSPEKTETAPNKTNLMSMPAHPIRKFTIRVQDKG